MNTTIVTLLEAVLNKHLTASANGENESDYACNAVKWAAAALTGTQYGEDYKQKHVGEMSIQIREDIRAYIEDYYTVEEYLAAKELTTDPYVFRKNMLRNLIARYQAQLVAK